ncbi:MAG: ABC transporter permease [Acidimicrobiales bacterium]
MSDWIVNEPKRGWRRLALGEAWRRRDLALTFATRDFKVRYRQTILGVAWALLEPLAASIALVLVFGRLAKVAPEGTSHLAFTLAGFAAWSYFSSASSAASQSLVGQVDLITKVYFPRILAPIGSLLPGVVDMGIALVLASIVAAIDGQFPGIELLALPVALALLVLATVGVSLVFATLNVRFRDVRYTYPMLLQVLFFLTPVAYSPDLVDGAWAWVYGLNPFAGIVSAIRWSLLGADQPHAWWLSSVGVSVVLLVLGVTLFQQAERRFSDVI